MQTFTILETELSISHLGRYIRFIGTPDNALESGEFIGRLLGIVRLKDERLDTPATLVILQQIDEAVRVDSEVRVQLLPEDGDGDGLSHGRSY